MTTKTVYISARGRQFDSQTEAEKDDQIYELALTLKKELDACIDTYADEIAEYFLTHYELKRKRK